MICTTVIRPDDVLLVSIDPTVNNPICNADVAKTKLQQLFPSNQIEIIHSAIDITVIRKDN